MNTNTQSLLCIYLLACIALCACSHTRSITQETTPNIQVSVGPPVAANNPPTGETGASTQRRNTEGPATSSSSVGSKTSPITATTNVSSETKHKDSVRNPSTSGQLAGASGASGASNNAKPTLRVETLNSRTIEPRISPSAISAKPSSIPSQITPISPPPVLDPTTACPKSSPGKSIADAIHLPDIELNTPPRVQTRTIQVVIPEAPPDVHMPSTVLPAPANSTDTHALLLSLIGTWSRTSDGGPDLLEGGYSNTSWTFDGLGQAICRRNFPGLEVTKGFAFVLKSATVIHIEQLPGSAKTESDLDGFRGITLPAHKPPCDLPIRVDKNTMEFGGIVYTKNQK